MNPVDLSLYAILDPTQTKGRDLARLADDAVRGGITLLQYRDKLSASHEVKARARAIHQALAGRVPLLLNDHVHIAAEIGAEGVHIGREDMSPFEARNMLGARAIIGVTLKNEADLHTLDPKIVDYGCIGGVYATTSKDNPDPPLGIIGFQALLKKARLSGLPIGAIAGIDKHNLGATIGAGADGVAIISAIFAADHVEAAARELRGLIDTARVDGALRV